MEQGTKATIEALDEIVARVKGGEFAAIVVVTRETSHVLQVNASGETVDAESVASHLFNLGCAVGRITGSYVEQAQTVEAARAFLAAAVAGVHQGATESLGLSLLAESDPISEAVN